MMRALLDAVVRTKCHIAIVDLTGVDSLDTATVDHLFKLVSAVSLLGSRCVVSGISAIVAQMVSQQGMDLLPLHTFRTLRDALRFALYHEDVQGSGRNVAP